MRVQCDVCERSMATVMCCADEAALCTECDTRVHAANKLANKHQRISLLGTSDAPRCDICQEKTAFFFCLEDRALLCRDCDVSIHTVNTLSSNHQRFLLTGLRVSLDAISGQDVAEAAPEEAPRFTPAPKLYPSVAPPTKASPVASAKPEPVPTFKPPVSTPYGSAPLGRTLGSLGAKVTGMTSINLGQQKGSGLTRKPTITEFLTESIPSWRVDELLNLPDLADGYNIGDIGSSKAELQNLGDFDWTADLSLFEEQMYAESLHEVPQLPSPPTASGLSRSARVGGVGKGKAKQDMALVPEFDDSFVVPDLGLQSSPISSSPMAKRRRAFYEY